MSAPTIAPAAADRPEPRIGVPFDPIPALPAALKPRLTESGFWCEPWCPPHCAGHADASTLHQHTTDLEHFGGFGVIIASETGRPAHVALCDVPSPQANLDEDQADELAEQLHRAAAVVRRINSPHRLTDDEITAQLLALLRGPVDDDALFAAYDDLAAVVGRERLDRLDDAASQVYLTEKRAAERAPEEPVFVHWARQNPPLGDPAQCGSATGRATRVASAVTCPACKAWMADEAWTRRSDTFGGAA